MSSDQAVTASFAVVRHTLRVLPAGSGTVISSPVGINCGATCSAQFDSGQQVTLTATPAAGWKFSGWGGACSGSATTCVLTMVSDQSVTANFVNPPADTPPTLLGLSYSGQSLGVKWYAGQMLTWSALASDPDRDVHFTYSWVWGDGTSGCVGVPSWAPCGASEAHIFKSPGQYTVTMIVTDSAGLTATGHDTITIYPLPSAASITAPIRALGGSVATISKPGGSVSSSVPIPSTATKVTGTTSVGTVAGHGTSAAIASRVLLGKATKRNVKAGALTLNVRPKNGPLLRRIKRALHKADKHTVPATLTIVVKLANHSTVRVVQHIRLRF
jgi:hypothetical protein